MWRAAVIAVVAVARIAGAALPDLVTEAFDVEIEQGAGVDPGDVVEGCAGGASGRTLLRFSMRTRNVGNGDVFLGDPGCPDCHLNPGAACANPLFVCAPAHGHAHFEGYALAELVSPGGDVVAVGHKIGFCILDLECAAPKYSCSYQGLTAGCSDVYFSDLPCQYIDLTGVVLTPGDYELRVTVDPENRIEESDETNNTIVVPLTIDCDTARDVLPACLPNPYLCYGTTVHGTSERKLDPRPTLSARGTFGAADLEATRGLGVCTPASAGTEPRRDEEAHLRSYGTRKTKTGATIAGADGVRIVTQLGELALDVGAPDRYVAPASAGVGIDPPALVTSRHTIDRFLCFPTRVPRPERKAVRPTEITVDDRFAPVRTLVLKKPRRLCTPVAVDGAPMRLLARDLLCYDIAKTHGRRIRGIRVQDEFGSATVDLGRPDELCLLAEKNPPHPVAETLEPCAGTVDVWRFFPQAGQTVDVRVDTTDPATTADLCAELTCGDVVVKGDDETPCTAAPPAFGCPHLEAIATTADACTVTVRACSGGCASSARADYALRAAVAGEEASPALLVDDGATPP
jgi:hypothetical protein